MATKIESNNWGKEKKDYIKEALEYTGEELSQLQRASFVEKVSNNSWNYKFNAVKTYLEWIKNDYSYLNLSKNKNTTVMATQIALFKAWYMWVGHIDAKWWPYTMSCIKKFQRENNLPVSGYLTKRTVNKLIAVAEEKQATKKEERIESPSKKETKKPTTKKPNTSQRQSSIDRWQKETELLSQQDTTKIKNAVHEIWKFDMYENFIIKEGKEISKWNKKFLKILGTEYEEYPVEWLMSPENNTPKNRYHVWQNYFIFWKFINNRCYDWVKLSYWGNIIEKWSFDINEEYEVWSWKREFMNNEVKQEYENPNPYPGLYHEV